MVYAEGVLQTVEPREEDILRLEADLQEFRPALDTVNLIGPQLCQVCVGFLLHLHNVWILYLIIYWTVLLPFS